MKKFRVTFEIEGNVLEDKGDAVTLDAVSLKNDIPFFFDKDGESDVVGCDCTVTNIKVEELE